MEEEVEWDVAVAGGRRTVAVIETIANSISLAVRMQVDFPSPHESGNTLDYKFYSKKLAIPFLIPFVIISNSVLSEKIKRNCLVQQAMMRLRNTRKTMPWIVHADILTDFSLKMKL